MTFESAESAIRAKMENAGIEQERIGDFLRMVARARAEREERVPLELFSVPDTEQLLEVPAHSRERERLAVLGRRKLAKAVVVKLNGGRSTTMGGEVPKGILKAKDGLSYLEIIARQIRKSRDRWDVHLPLILMNSFFTHEQTLEVLESLDVAIETFLQSRVPRLLVDSYMPLDTGTEEDWVPPGHGDVYESLRRSGMLESLLSRGYRWAFISNLDNLAATMEPWILGLIAEQEIEFLLEVTARTPVDRKGGTLVVRDGNLELLEIAQVAEEDRPEFQDIERFRVFNTNNVWVDLEALHQVLEADKLSLPIIRNRKEIEGQRIVQLETAMGAALGCFDNSRGLRVTRDRFFPTKKVEDLFLLRSDACVLDERYRVVPNPERPSDLSMRPVVSFSDDFLESPLQLNERFEDPDSVSLVRAKSFEVAGDVYFARNVAIEGSVKVEAPPGESYRVAQGTHLTDGTYP